MTPYSLTRLLGCFALAAGWALGIAWRGQDLVSASDCAFLSRPQNFQDQLSRQLTELAQTTEDFIRRSGQAGNLNASLTAETVSVGFIDNIPSRNYIDDFIFARMQQDNVPHAPPSSEVEFLRRVSLDLTGRIPTSQEVRGFLADSDANKRRRLIERTLASPAFVDKWTMYFGDLLRNTERTTNVRRFIEGRNAYHQVIRDFVATGTPYDVFVKRLISATGSNYTAGEANWAVDGITPMGPIQDTYDTLLVRAATQFLGLGHFDCLLCHAGAGHLDSLNLWAVGVQRAQAWEMAAFFSGTRIRRQLISEQPRKYSWNVTDAAQGGYRLNTDSGNRPPRYPIGNQDLVRPRYIFSGEQVAASTYREAFAENLVRDRQFARATVNYLWKQMMGLGIVEPPDQFDPARLDPAGPLPEGWKVQPSHPELLEALTDDFIHSGYNVRHILFLIADSSAYQLSATFPGEWKIQYTPYFARRYVRRLWAEEIHDAVVRATGAGTFYEIEGFPEPVSWAMQFPDTEEPRKNRAVRFFLDYFLRGDRDEEPRSGQPTVLQAMNVMNNSFVTERVRSTYRNSTVARLLADPSLSDRELLEELFLSTLSRLPTEEEMTRSVAALKEDRVKGAENVQWVLLNKVDFLYNY